MLYVKMMSNERFADNHPNKNYTLWSVNDADEISFNWSPGDNPDSPHLPAIFISKDDGSVIEKVLTGNVYIMNEAGKTIASHGC
jgi:hypothetical protein